MAVKDLDPDGCCVVMPDADQLDALFNKVKQEGTPVDK